MQAHAGRGPDAVLVVGIAGSQLRAIIYEWRTDVDADQIQSQGRDVDVNVWTFAILFMKMRKYRTMV